MYLFLQCNPAVWLCGLAGLLLSLLSIVSPWFFKMERLPRHRYLAGVFGLIYLGYMIVISRLDRVMYLYHYFIPLAMSFLLFALSITDLQKLGWLEITPRRREIGLWLMTAAIVASYWFYRPLTYYRPITREQFQSRSILRVWDLIPQGGARTNGFANALPPRVIMRPAPPPASTAPPPGRPAATHRE